MSKVVLVRCESYDYAKVNEAVKKGVALLGGVDKFAKKGEKILLKVNLLVGEHPDKCVTTHPSVFRAVGELFKSTGAQVSYGDSPAFGSTLGAAKKAGLTGPAQEAGLELKEFEPGQEVLFAQGKQNKKFIIAKAVLDSDGVISLPKLKAHGFEKFTGCIKNQFGCIPGLLKGEFHVKLPDAIDFARMLVDLDTFVRPRLYIMDGITAMEGNGPRGGNPKQMNVLLLSEDPVALDATVCRMINLDLNLVPTVKFGTESGRGVSAQNAVELVGDAFDQFRTDSFDIDRSPLKPFKSSGILKFFSNALVAKPVINKGKCAKCGTCIKVCPANPKAVDWVNGDKSRPPEHRYGICIRCYCCQELCPEKAIDLKKPVLRRLFGKRK
jgi:uncharacterized protein (DUF362 family)/Pyruvate/2-oxoacid:ferredoxin oxidoreductase delta subunit